MAGSARAGRGRVEADHARRHRGADKLATECVVNLIRTQSMLATELKRRFRTGAGFNVLATVDTPGRPHVVPVGFRLGLDDGS
jgi:predicted pyridoxine 5'-phosphate oxidase superfamily flavin-nucleotide-binding protein